MGKVKIGSINHQNLIKGDINLLGRNEILVSTSEGYTILRKRSSNGKIKAFVVIPLEEFKIEDKEVQTTNKKVSTKKKKSEEDK